MQSVPGTNAFAVAAQTYDAFMGRYSQPLAVHFAEFAGVRAGQRALDVGCGPGALTGELVRQLGPDAVAGCDPSAGFVAACRERHPGVDVRLGAAEDLPFDAESFDVVAAQLVLHFVGDSARAASELTRVTRPGGTIAVCVWDFAGGMQLLRAFWDMAVRIDPNAPNELKMMRFGSPGELSAWLTEAGLSEVTEGVLRVETRYEDFDEVWAGLAAGVGPAGRWAAEMMAERRHELRDALYHQLGSPPEPSLWARSPARPGACAAEPAGPQPHSHLAGRIDRATPDRTTNREPASCGGLLAAQPHPPHCGTASRSWWGRHRRPAG